MGEALQIDSIIEYFLQLVVICIVWLVGKSRRKHFFLRVIGSLVVCLLSFYIVYRLFILFSIYSWFLFGVYFLFIIMLTSLAIVFCYDLSFSQSVYIILVATVSQQIISCIRMFIMYFAELDELTDNLLNGIITVGCVSGNAVLRKTFKDIIFYNDKINRFTLIICCFMDVVMLFLSCMNYDSMDSFGRSVIISGYRILVSCFLLFVVFGSMGLSRIYYQKSKTELLLQKESMQYNFSKELIDLVNIKYHDLKYKKFIADDEKDMLADYDLLVDCGNPAMNTVLTEKNIFCKKHGIQFSIIADGKILTFISASDVYSLLGNIIDNAVEHLLTLPEDDRIMSLQISSVNDMAHIHCENICRVEPKFNGGVPVSTKGDDLNHGFGTKSIVEICKKYDGHLQIRYKEGIYYVDIMFPLVTI